MFFCLGYWGVLDLIERKNSDHPRKIGTLLKLHHFSRKLRFSFVVFACILRKWWRFIILNKLAGRGRCLQWSGQLRCSLSNRISGSSKKTPFLKNTSPMIFSHVLGSKKMFTHFFVLVPNFHVPIWDHWLVWCYKILTCSI